MEQIRESIGHWADRAKQRSVWLVALGVLTALAGILSMVSPLIGGLGVAVLVGAAMAIAGIARTVGAVHAGSFGQGALAFIGGILTFVGGAILAPAPGSGWPSCPSC